MTAQEFPWPVVDGRWQPVWAGSCFRVGNNEVAVLAYDGGRSGWSDALTQMHEESAGSDHPIDRFSREWALSALRRHMKTEIPVVLEVGSSSGFLLRELHVGWPGAMVIGSDFVREPLERFAAKSAGIPLMQFDLVCCPLPDECVDAVVLLNVLEHIERDGDALRQVGRILKPGGIAVVEVPAGPHLFDAYDEHLQHYRRYSAQAIRALLQDAGLLVAEESHLGFTAYPAFALVKRFHRQWTGAGGEDRRRLVESNIEQTRSSALFRGLLRCEAWLGRYTTFPFGIRCVAIGRKAEPVSRV